MAKKKNNAPPYHLIRLGTITEEFQNEAAHFTQMMSNGPGIRSQGILDSIRKMEQLYMTVVATLDAARTLNGGTGITLEDGLDALDMIRQMAAEDEAATDTAEN